MEFELHGRQLSVLFEKGEDYEKAIKVMGSFSSSIFFPVEEDRTRLTATLTNDVHPDYARLRIEEAAYRKPIVIDSVVSEKYL